jgi:hypothetical protein
MSRHIEAEIHPEIIVQVQLYGWDAVQQAISNTTISARSFPLSWNEFIERYGRPKHFDLWLPLANEENVRMAIEQNVPPLLIYATTNPNWCARYGRSIAGTPGDCLLDRFPLPSADTSLECSKSSVQTREGTVDAALPFLSLFAGLLVFADVVRLQFPGYPHVPNYASFDFGGRLDEIQKWNWAPRPGCSCTNLSPALYKLFNRNSKYFGLGFSNVD